MTDKLTRDEVSRMFDGTIPEAAMDIIYSVDYGTTADDLRARLQSLAASMRPTTGDTPE